MKVPMDRAMEQLMTEPIAALDFPVRTVNTLEGEGITTVGDLLHCCPLSQNACQHRCICKKTKGLPEDWQAFWYLSDIENMGEKTIADIRITLVKAIQNRGKLVDE